MRRPVLRFLDRVRRPRADSGTEVALRQSLAAADEARRALAECEARLRLALAADDVSVYEIDVLGDRVWLDHRAAALSRGLLPSETWLPRSDPRWREWLARIHPEDRERRRTELQATIDGRAESFALTYRFLDRDGAWRWLVHRGAVVARVPGSRRPSRIVAVARDVTEQNDQAATLERQVAERTAALLERERRYRGIFESAFQITSLLTRDGVVLELNRAALEFHGLSEREAIGRRAWEFGPWSHCPRAVAAFKARLAQAGAGQFVRYETTQPDASGRMLTFDFSLKPIVDEAGQVTLLVAEARDITERAGLQAQLVQAQKMEVVGQLTGGVAHDFNNLLQALVGNLDLIRRLAESTGDARLLHLTANAQRAAARGTRLTRQLLAFSRQQKLRTERVDVGRLTGGMNELLRRAAGETVRLETAATPDLWPCLIDPTRFETTLLNLVLNARDAMPEGGTLRVTSAVEEVDVGERVDLLARGTYVTVSIADTGVGMDEATRARCFEPLFTTKNPLKGTGLGLASARRLVQESGGVITCTSRLGSGTTFKIWLPAFVASDDPTTQRVDDQGSSFGVASLVSPTARTPMSGTILLCEDDAGLRRLALQVLRRNGFEVIETATAEEALEQRAAHEATIDLLVSDVILPLMAGSELAARWQSEQPDFPVLLMSGTASLDVISHLTPGSASFLAKPFRPSELVDAVVSLLSRRAVSRG